MIVWRFIVEYNIENDTLWRLITASSQAKLVPPPTPLLRMRVGVISHTCGILAVSLLKIHVQYFTASLLIGSYHACLSHSGDPTITGSLQHLAKQWPTQKNSQETRHCCCHHSRSRSTPSRSAGLTTTLTLSRRGSAASTRLSPPAGSQSRSQNSTGHYQSSRSR